MCAPIDTPGANAAVAPSEEESGPRLASTNGRRPGTNGTNGRRPGERAEAEQRLAEERLLREYARTRSPALRGELVSRFLPLARSLAMRYRGSPEPLEDLIQVASLGLVKAIDGFDPARGANFKGYAVPTILGWLRHHFRDGMGRPHLSRRLQELVMRVEGAIDVFTHEHGRPPTVGEIAERLRLDSADVLEAFHAGETKHLISIDVPRNGERGDGAPLVESLGEIERGYDAVEANLACANANLEERERLVLRLRFVDGLTQSEIGERLSVSQMQVSRIMRAALRKLLDEVQADTTAASPPQVS